MSDEELTALVARIESRPNDAPLPTEYMLDEAASAIRQLMKERDEAVTYLEASIERLDALIEKMNAQLTHSPAPS